tara:strand:+ start:279 stop:563 length:285 start_codon:yes stop_codon:yes gene_type:complete
MKKYVVSTQTHNGSVQVFMESDEWPHLLMGALSLASTNGDITLDEHVPGINTEYSVRRLITIDGRAENVQFRDALASQLESAFLWRCADADKGA